MGGWHGRAGAEGALPPNHGMVAGGLLSPPFKNARGANGRGLRCSLVSWRLVFHRRGVIQGIVWRRKWGDWRFLVCPGGFQDNEFLRGVWPAT